MKTIPSELGFLGVMPMWRFQQTRAQDFPTQRVCVDNGNGKFSEYWSNGEKWLSSAQVDGSSLVTNDGEVLALANNGQPGTTLTATGTGYASLCEFWGIEVSAYNGGPQTVVVRNGGAGGLVVATFTVSGVGFYSYSGSWNAPGNGQNLSRAMSTDVHLTISGGTSRSITPIVSPT